MNIELLLKVKEQILKKPELFEIFSKILELVEPKFWAVFARRVTTEGPTLSATLINASSSRGAAGTGRVGVSIKVAMSTERAKVIFIYTPP